ncbi:hypothetical protein ADL35_02415 [Streptomyces sp. NRRL WC-3753]|nr:hypothetical protein ADL35_02415 [Streptomyces sp. NRRL WC-3753]
MGLSVWPAPEDSGIVGPTGATGPQGPKGATGATGAKGATGATGPAGTPGSKVLTGTAAPTASIGVDGDLYIQDDTRTFLGVTNTTLTHWKKTAGTWAQVGQPVGGSKWYVNNTSTNSGDTKPGDMLLRIDTGDIWQRSDSGWGSPIGNLKGSKGDTGAVGPRGPKGDPGDGNVNTVNGKTGPDITLAAGDVGALPTTGTTENVYFTVKGDGSNGPATFYGSASSDKRFAVRRTGGWYSNALDNVAYNVGVGDTLTQFGGGQFVLGIRNVSTKPTTTPDNGAIVYVEGGKLKVLQSNGETIAVGEAPVLPSEFTPEDLGLKAWAFDPAVANSTPLYCGTTPRLAAVKLNSTQTISKIVWHFGGYAGGLVSGSWAAIYDTSMARKGVASSIETGNEPAEQHGKGGNASAAALDSAVTLSPGVYYVVWRFNYNTTTGDGPMILGAENGFGSPSNTYGLNNLWRYGRLNSSPSSAPSSLSGIINESNRFWVALA